MVRLHAEQDTEACVRTWIMAALVASCAGGAAAQEELGSYFTVLSVQDMVNSDGIRLTEFCQIVQQDRANYHRFKRRDINDEGDAFFGSAQARQIIGQLCVVAPGQEYIREDVMNGVERYVWIQVLGTGGKVSAIVVNEGGG
jgi:hypothetical protein